MGTVTNTVQLPGGDPAVGAVATIELVDVGLSPIFGFITATDVEITGRFRAVADGSGVWSKVLQPNGDISPANTRYRITETIPGVFDSATVKYVIVPSGAGPFQVNDIRFDPSSLPPQVPSTKADYLRVQNAADWAERVITTDDTVSNATTLTFEHGVVVARGAGGTGQRSNRRSIRQLPGSPGGYSRVRSRLYGTPTNPAVSNVVPQRGHAHGIQQDISGLWTAVVVTHDIAFGIPTILNLAVWRSETSAGGTGSVFAGGTNLDQVAVSAAVRTTNVVTLTVPTGHGFVRGDVVTVDLANNSYDGTFVVDSVTATTIVYKHTGTDLTTSTGTVALSRAVGVFGKSDVSRSTAVTASARTSGVVTATVAAGHPWNVGDEVTVDLAVASYDGVFKITELPSATQIRWRQDGVADDAAGGAGSVSSPFPYWLETEWRPGIVRARVWPDASVTSSDAKGGHGPIGVPSWESPFAATFGITGLSVPEPDPAKGLACGLVTAHLSSGAAPFLTDIRYDNVRTWALYPV
jgi:hypothetical protein